MSDDGYPQLEDGYTRIANELLEAIIKQCKGPEAILLAVIRETYGYKGYKQNEISNKRMCELTGILNKNLHRAIKDAVFKGYISILKNEDKQNPTYKEVCSGETGHAEVMEVVYDSSQTTFEKLTKLFFEIHDPTQIKRQGPDVGEQYRSEIFYVNNKQKQTAEKLIKILENKGYKIATELSKANTFWEAEEYHQDYYSNNGKQPYCHSYTKRF